MLAAALLAFKGFGLWVKVGIALAILAVIVGSVWFVYHSIKMTGYREAEEIYKPKLEKLQLDLKQTTTDLTDAVRVNAVFQLTIKNLDDQVRDQNLAVQKLEATALTAQTQARDALARVVANQKRYSAEISRLQSIVAGPSTTEGECEASNEADDILRSILRDRMSISTGAADQPAGGGGTEGDSGQSTRSAALRDALGLADYPAANEARLEEGEQGAGGGSGSPRFASAR